MFSGLTLLTSTFEDAEAVFGPAKTVTRSLALETTVSSCYASSRQGDRTRLQFRSSALGKGRFLTGYMLSTAPRRGACALSPKVGVGLPAVDGRLHLGMSKDQVVAMIGTPGIRNLDSWSADDLPKGGHPNIWAYVATWHAPFSEVDRSAIENLLEKSDVEAHRYAWTQVTLRFRDSKLVRIDVDHGVGY